MRGSSHVLTYLVLSRLFFSFFVLTYVVSNVHFLSGYLLYTSITTQKTAAAVLSVVTLNGWGEITEAKALSLGPRLSQHLAKFNVLTRISIKEWPRTRQAQNDGYSTIFEA